MSNTALENDQAITISSSGHDPCCQGMTTFLHPLQISELGDFQEAGPITLLPMNTERALLNGTYADCVKNNDS